MISIELILRKIKLKNLLSYQETEFTNLKKYNILIGKNSSGKSNLFKIFQLIYDCYNAKSFNKNFIYNGDENKNAYTILEFEFTEKFRRELLFSLFNHKVFEKSFGFNEGKFDYPSPNEWRQSEKKFDWFTSKGYFIGLSCQIGFHKKNNTLCLDKISIINKNQEFLIYRLDIEQDMFRSNTLNIHNLIENRDKLDEYFNRVSLERSSSSSSSVSLKNQLNQFADSNYLIKPLIKKLISCFFENIFIIPEHREFKPYMDTTNVNITEILPRGTNLVKLLHKKTVKNERDWLKRFNDDLQYFIEEVDELKQDLDDDDQTNLILKERGLELSLYYENMGAGILNVALFITCIMENDKNSIICIQEPELYLHPGLERKLKGYFIEKAQQFTFFITTHSREFLTKDRELCSVHLIRKLNAQTTVINIPLTEDNFRLIYEDLDIDLDKITEEKKAINNETFLAKLIMKMKEEEFETKLWDFKKTLDFLHISDPQVKRNKKIEFCEKIAAFGNSDGGLIIVGITDELPRKIEGISLNENDLNDLNNLFLDLITPSRDFVHVQLISINDNEENKKNCLCLIIAQTSEVLGVKHDNGTIKYVIRTTSGTKPVDPQIIRDSKKVIKRDNYNYIEIIKERFLH